jgi:general secretion pathway protein G
MRPHMMIRMVPDPMPPSATPPKSPGEEQPESPNSPITAGTRLVMKGLVGCTVFVVLLGLAMFLLVRPRAAARQAEQREQIRQDLMLIESALERHRLAHQGAWPENLNVLFVPDENGASLLPSKAPPRDPWGQGYFYAAPSHEQTRGRIWTLGRDRREGGEGENRDFSNLEWPSPR